MADHVDVGVLHRSDHPAGHRLARLCEVGVDRRHREVEPLQERSRPVDRSVGIDVQLRSVQQCHPWVAFLERLQLRSLSEHLLVRHPLHRQVRRMVRHGVVGVALGGRRRQHLFEGRDAVGEIGVRVQVAPDLRQFQHVGELGGRGSLDLAAVLPEGGRDPREPQPLVHLFLGLGHVSAAINASLSTSKSPYSFSLRPLRTAISRIRTLCAFDPVK